MTIESLQPHGFCAGVANALRKAEALLASRPAPVYCLHELVHNELVVADLKAKGMVFVESLDDVPSGATVLFSAHGVSPAVRAQAAARGLTVEDATCPFVTRVHKAAKAFADRGLPVVIIGHPDHAEVKGIRGEVPDARRGQAASCIVLSPQSLVPSAKEGSTVPLALSTRHQAPSTSSPAPSTKHQAPSTTYGLVSQTTMNADDVAAIVAELKTHYSIETMAEVCRATKERQDAVKAFDGDALLVLGSANSSNTKRLCEVARCRTFRAGTLDEVNALDFGGITRLGVTSGASTPESFFNAAFTHLQEIARN